jgi:hypothetical protein
LEPINEIEYLLLRGWGFNSFFKYCDQWYMLCGFLMFCNSDPVSSMSVSQNVRFTSITCLSLKVLTLEVGMTCRPLWMLQNPKCTSIM